MKIQIKRLFRYQKDAQTVVDLPPGVYAVPKDISKDVAEKALKFGKASVMAEKKAPENKVVKVAENKATVEKPKKRRGRPRAKPKP